MFGMHDKNVQLAWREKMALCTIIFFLMAFLGFLTFAFNAVLCQPNEIRMNLDDLGSSYLSINGYAFDVSTYNHNFGTRGALPFNEIYASTRSRTDRDLSNLFQSNFANLPACQSMLGDSFIAKDDYLYHCTLSGVDPAKSKDKFGTYSDYCHGSTNELAADMAAFRAEKKRRELYVTWDMLESRANPYITFNGHVVDFSKLGKLKKSINLRNVNGIDLSSVFEKYRNKDASMFFNSNSTMRNFASCLVSMSRIGSIDASSVGCIASDVMLWLSLIVILSLVFSRFIMAILYRWVMAPKLGRKLSLDEKRHFLQLRNGRERDAAIFENDRSSKGSPLDAAQNARSRFSVYDGDNYRGSILFSDTASELNSNASAIARSPAALGPRTSMADSLRSDSKISIVDSMKSSQSVDPTLEEVMHTILLVTCYSEGRDGIKLTLDSLAGTDYLDTHKLIFVIADGSVTGAGETMSTPDIVVSLMEKDPAFPEEPNPYSYVAIADGAKRHNMAQVYAGYYRCGNRKVPMVCVSKCGTPDEKSLPKPGNRGKRDSQIILMSFLQKVMFDERLTPLDYDLFQKIHKVSQVTPDAYEMVLMVDADTKVMPDSLSRMVACFSRDPTVMGLTGETKITAPFTSWVTMIQVFEYFISHHLAKAFESMFGGVTCLPGCFCAYRIKSPKGDMGRHWVPILANPDIVENYSENVVDTLHKKNLYLLGEDRYLTTLMLRSFPSRKMLFIPQATCETMVPDTLSILLSQRRRWINSTIHNLLELVLVRDLCGTFCISMQCVVFFEIIGTVVLPAAISFTFYLVLSSLLFPPVQMIPLLLLAAILGLPGLLIVVTARSPKYLFWMVIYLLSLVIWNFVLPLYGMCALSVLFFLVTLLKGVCKLI
jgi:chitin synthase